MNARNKLYKPAHNAKKVKPLKQEKSAKAPDVVNKTSSVKSGVNIKLKPDKKPCPTGASVCYCNPKMTKKAY